ncbi:MAG: iron chelate uptake ABC transporter family permease subunit, partial [Clostridia bacterium]|nr:iron chelate uptake ABC transporter family permease subunit [Clostridia bacterium]
MGKVKMAFFSNGELNPEEPAGRTLPKGILFGGLLLLLFFLIGLALTAGPAGISWTTVVKGLTGLLPGVGDLIPGELGIIEKKILFEIRLPRIILSVLVGIALATAGAVYQGLFRNPMADPYVLGASSAAALGATTGFAVFSSLRFSSLSLVSVLAFAGALLATVLVYNLARTGRQVSLTVLLLAGIAVSTLLSSLTSMLMILQGTEMQRIVFWLMGGFSASRWSHVFDIFPFVLLGFGTVMLFARDLNLMLLGEEKAHQLGVNIPLLRMVLTFSASLLVAAAVSVSGIIGFVGLVVPHMLRLVTSPDHRLLIPV